MIEDIQSRNELMKPAIELMAEMICGCFIDFRLFLSEFNQLNQNKLISWNEFEFDLLNEWKKGGNEKEWNLNQTEWVMKSGLSGIRLSKESCGWSRIRREIKA